MHHLTISVTDLGDSAVTLPLAALTIAILLTLRRNRMALLWGGAIVAAAMAIVALKLALASSPSGHAAVSTIVYGGFVVMVGPSLGPVLRWLSRIGAAVLIAAIAVSRILLHEHSVAETIVGLAVGLAALAAFRAILFRTPPDRVPAVWLCAAAVVMVVLMHGVRWHAEYVIRGLG